MDNITKFCRDCKTEKSDSEFYKTKNGKFGLGAYCKQCTLIRSANWRKNNVERHYQQSINWRAAHPEQKKISDANWRKLNKDKIHISGSKYIKKNPEKSANTYHKRRAKKLLNGDFLVRDKFLKRLYSSECVYCGYIGKIHQDHIIPISRGGRHSEGNLQPLCVSCNSSKGNKLMMEWRIVKEQPLER
jgi:5-methylcytosine-specific restriction endonuclease McrA